MKSRSIEEIEEFCKTVIWPDESTDEDFSLKVTYDGEGFTIEVAQMYCYVPLNLARLLRLSEFFGTTNINDSRYSSDGCESCDYGSSYEVTLHVQPEEK